jgi:arabinogalactan endo-1,4-beta-galactosidase
MIDFYFFVIKLKIYLFLCCKINYMNYIKYSCLSILFFSLLSCNSSTEEKKIDTKVIAETENSFNSEEYDFVLPQPVSLAKAFQASGLSYYSNLTNPTSNLSYYNEKVKQLLNLGVYSTDLAYCAMNGKSQEARNYLSAIQTLGNSVGLKPVFSDKKLVEKFDKNLNNMEAVEDLIYDIQERSEEYMQDNDIRYLSVVQFAGAWTEGMYLGIKDIEKSKSKNNNLSITVVDQMNLLKSIIKGLKTYPTSDRILTEVLEKLNDVSTKYESFESVKKATEGDVFVSPKLSNEEFDKLADKIYALRTFIVK